LARIVCCFPSLPNGRIRHPYLVLSLCKHLFQEMIASVLIQEKLALCGESFRTFAIDKAVRGPRLDRQATFLVKSLIVGKAEAQTDGIMRNQMVSDRSHKPLSISFSFLVGDDASDIEEGKGFLVAENSRNRLEKARSKDLLSFRFDQEKIEPVMHLQLGWQKNAKLSLRSFVELAVKVIVQFVSPACEECLHKSQQ
jgi:hypothetical protein